MRLSCVAALALAGALSVPVTGAAPAQAAPGSLCEDIRPDSVSDESDLPSAPLRRLGVERAAGLLAERGIRPGEGVGVAVIDSGVAPAARGRMEVEAPASWAEGDYESSHGTTVAGLIAGHPRDDGKPVGVAPGARIVDLRVYSQPDDRGTGGIPVAGVTAALEWLADHAREQGIGVAVMAFGFGPEPPGKRMRKAVKAAAHDVVLVAAGGNRPQEGQPGYEQLGGEPRPGEDVAGTVYPAAYDEHVLAATATADGASTDASEHVLLSSDVDVAVPTFDAVSVGVNGRTCVVQEVASSWAAAITAGVAALVRSAYPDETAAQIRARLVATASGSAAAPTRATGAGVLRPGEAVTRVLAPRPDGELDVLPVEDTGRQRLTAPEPEADPVAGVLDDALWWGLFGGAGVVVALLLGPMVARRRG